ncbi:hypothetical protein C0J52_23500 [Blattella germanica]|nr:hypothetical protein C0J52_23500 [Blattella germanica]
MDLNERLRELLGPSPVPQSPVVPVVKPNPKLFELEYIDKYEWQETVEKIRQLRKDVQQSKVVLRYLARQY